MQAGKLIVLSAPSGAGKTTLVRALMERDSSLCFSVSYTTRPKRGNEQHGEDYFFVDEQQFSEMRSAGAFLESACVFRNWYGTSRENTEKLINAGKNVLLEIDWQGAQQVRKSMPECCSIFILPPSIEELERRLRDRSTDSNEVIEYRLGKAREDIAHWKEFDYVVINDKLDEAFDQIRSIIAGNNTENLTTDSRIPDQLKGLTWK